MLFCKYFLFENYYYSIIVKYIACLIIFQLQSSKNKYLNFIFELFAEEKRMHVKLNL